jgi:hypothetical protein
MVGRKTGSEPATSPWRRGTIGPGASNDSVSCAYVRCVRRMVPECALVVKQSTKGGEHWIGSTIPPDTTVGVGSSPIAPIVAWQPSLWADESTVVDASFCGLERIQLDEDSWLDVCPGWVSGSDQAFEELLRDVVWRQRRRWMYDREVDEPRLTSGRGLTSRPPFRTSGLRTLARRCPRTTTSRSIRWGSISTATAPTALPGTVTAYRPRSRIP